MKNCSWLMPACDIHLIFGLFEKTWPGQAMIFITAQDKLTAESILVSKIKPYHPRAKESLSENHAFYLRLVYLIRHLSSHQLIVGADSPSRKDELANIATMISGWSWRRTCIAWKSQSCTTDSVYGHSGCYHNLPLPKVNYSPTLISNPFKVTLHLSNYHNVF